VCACTSIFDALCLVVWGCVTTKTHPTALGQGRGLGNCVPDADLGFDRSPAHACVLWVDTGACAAGAGVLGSPQCGPCCALHLQGRASGFIGNQQRYTTAACMPRAHATQIRSQLPMAFESGTLKHGGRVPHKSNAAQSHLLGTGAFGQVGLHRSRKSPITCFYVLSPSFA
jgi:hypothetical protein